MNRLVSTSRLLFVLMFGTVCHADETIVMLRHAEKPPGGLGQLSCQGLNRALALPAVLLQKYGKPAALFAPNPGVHKLDAGKSYNYIRPLATIEPTAIRLSMAVNTDYGLDDLDGLAAALRQPAYGQATVFVAWEHRLIEQLARQLLKQAGADASVVPHWHSSDFDSLYIVSLRQQDGHWQATFRQERQGLDQQSLRCPGQSG